MPPSAVTRLTVDSSQPAWRKAGAQFGADRRQGWRHLADMEGGNDAGRDQQADQSPRRARR